MRTLASALLLSALMAFGASVTAASLTPLDETRLIYHTTARGTNSASALEAAKQEAVLASAGRVLLDGSLLLADELLEKYIQSYYNNFVIAAEVTRDQFVGSHAEIMANVYVDFARLKADLEEKKFLYVPAYKPQFLVFLSETLDGRPSAQGLAREALTGSFRANGLKPFQGIINNPPLTFDVKTDEFIFDSGIVAAQRNGIEVIVTGNARTRLREQRKVYYDEFFFYDCDMTISFIRVDTKETLFEAEATGSASARDQADAIRTSIDRAASAIAADITADFGNFWPVVVQEEGQFEILLTGVDDELLRIVTQQLERMKGGTRVHLKKMFGTSAVVVIETEASKADLLEALAATPFPTLTTLNPDAKMKFEVQVSG